MTCINRLATKRRTSLKAGREQRKGMEMIPDYTDPIPYPA
jgi:hypothetical protein